ncbi:MAG TPA: fatty acid desaturase [Ornithinibacter sp.]|nr:fatty acid desaturase [Ornithinibacter sp.]
MTLAPERRLISPTEEHHAGAQHASSKPHGINPRLSVTSTTPRPPRPAYKKSGRPNPAAHLSPEDIESIGLELDALRKEVMDSRGARDAAYIRRVIKAQRYLEVGSRALLLFSNVKVKGIRPAWWLGTAGLSVAKILENMEIGHNVMHGQWDWMRDPKIHSTAWEWDNASPSSQWKHSHNEIHHTFTNVLGRDNDLGYGILRVDEDQRWSLFYLFQPIWHVGNALLFEYSIAAYDLELGGYLAKKDRMSEEEKAKFRSDAKEVVAKIRRQATKDYVVHPALSAVTGSTRTTLTANVVANLVRNLWTNTVIICGHFPPGIATFEKTSIEGETRGEWYVRQMLGSGNISGSPAMHVMTGNLSHQIEHHLYPDMPSNRYAEIAPRIRDLMDRYDLPYVEGSLAKQAASVYWKVVQLSLPNKVEGRRRRDVVRLAAKKAWRKKSLDRF